MNFGFVALAMVGVWVFFLSDGGYHPLRAYETFALISFFTMTIWGCVWLIKYCFSNSLDGSMEQTLLSFPALEDVLESFLLSFCVVLYFVGTVYTINGHYDRSPVEEHILPVIGKERVLQIRTGRWSVWFREREYNYYATVSSFTPSWLGLLPNAPFILDPTERLSISQRDYDTLAPTDMQAVMQTRKGYLGIPWVQKKHVVEIKEPIRVRQSIGDFERGSAYLEEKL